MKTKIMMLITALGLFAAILIPILYAAETCTQVRTDTDGNAIVNTWTWATGGTTGGLTCDPFVGAGYVVRAVTDPGTPAPTDNYDVVINDANGVDVMAGLLANRDTANSEQIVESAAANLHTRFNGALTPVLTNSGTNKAGKVILYIQR